MMTTGPAPRPSDQICMTLEVFNLSEPWLIHLGNRGDNKQDLPLGISMFGG